VGDGYEVIEVIEMKNEEEKEKGLERFRFGEASTNEDKLPRHRVGEKFLKGPIPRKWLEEAASLPGKALHVAIELWFWAGIRGPEGIRLSGGSLAKLGVKRHAAYRAIGWLHGAGLISVQRFPGRKLIITIKDKR
jgi:hypothetical protein